MKTYEQIIKRIDMQIEHCKDCQDTDGQLKGFIAGLKKAKLIVLDCKHLGEDKSE
jgi:hypothetical protein